MADRQRLTSKEWQEVGDFVKMEKERRKGNRKALEDQWKEIDRQIAMTPLPREIASGEDQDWFPNTELPLQAQALEVISADARRLKFPRGTQWYSAHAEVSDDYRDRWNKRRESTPLVSNIPTPINLDQESADTLAKGAVDHFHRQYDFREKMDLQDAEAIKYGTFVSRVRPVTMATWDHTARGVKEETTIGPAVIPCSIQHTYLDDSPSAVMHEGVALRQSFIRESWQSLESLKLAAKKGGPDKGWLPDQINKLEGKRDNKHKRQQVEILEFEGDLVVPRSRSSLFLPNVILTVAINEGVARGVRFRTNDMPFSSYVVGHYMRDSVKSPYGTSPLMKGQPLQEAATLAANMLMAASALNADPYLLYDGNDQYLAAQGGPNVRPGGQDMSDSPNAIERVEGGDVGALLNTYVGLLKQYEDTVGVNDPRRGAAVRSHTTTGAHDLEASRGISRTDDFVTSAEQGPLTTTLDREYRIIKKVMTQARSINIDSGGIEGWVRLSAADLADNVAFVVHGSAGVINERDRAANFFGAVQFGLQVVAQAAQLGEQIDVNWQELIQHGFVLAGEQNAQRFFNSPSGTPPIPIGTTGGPGVQGASNVIAPEQFTGLAT